jgi:hypothetical protein
VSVSLLVTVAMCCSGMQMQLSTEVLSCYLLCLLLLLLCRCLAAGRLLLLRTCSLLWGCCCSGWP